MDGGAWWATVHGVARSRTRLGAFTFTFLCVEPSHLIKGRHCPKSRGDLFTAVVSESPVPDKQI